jgi:glucose-1-phosphate cytidylyltransferase
MTYGDGSADLDLDRLLQCHRGGSGWLATLTAVQQLGRWLCSTSTFRDGCGSSAKRPISPRSWIKVLSPKIFDRNHAATALDEDTLVHLRAGNQLGAFHHAAFWYAMDMLRDKRHIESLCGTAALPRGGPGDARHRLLER